MSSLNETVEHDDREEENEGTSHSGLKFFLFHGGSVYDAWFNCTSNQPATMTRDNLYWLSHDQVALFKTFRGTASRCKQTINHAVPRIKQPSSLLYDILLHCKNRSRIHQKIWLPVPIQKYPQYWNILFQL
ncbi:hypothetical protein Lal_00031168 [Lupinus albus]|nr:hypothetical protein Lal_00031168 [Lupinus albus]